MGRRSSWHGEHWPHLVSPSGVREPVHQGNAKTIEPEEIRRIIADFAAAARCGRRPAWTASRYRPPTST